MSFTHTHYAHVYIILYMYLYLIFLVLLYFTKYLYVQQLYMSPLSIHPTTPLSSPPSLHQPHLPLSNLKAIWLDPYWRMWSICHLTTRRGGFSSVKTAMWNRFLSKSRRISKRQGPLNMMEFDFLRLTL